MTNSSRLILFTTSLFLLSGCGGSRGNQPAARAVAVASMKAVGCKIAHGEMWNSLQQVAEDGGEFPTAAQIRESLIEAGAGRSQDAAAFARYVDAFVTNYEVTINGIRAKLQPEDIEGWKKALAEMEAGVHPTEVHEELDAEITASLAALTAAETELNQTCGIEDEVEFIDADGEGTNGKVTYQTEWEQLKATRVPEVYGARRVLATAYQSCDVLNLAPMTSSTPNVKGIRVVGRHRGGGNRRKIASLASVVSTDYYIKGMTLPKNSCFEVRSSPLIYDFGGKPFTTVSNIKMLDMFKNSGSGESVLGIDCSAYVFSSLMAAGLKTDPSRQMKANLVLAYGSGAFKEPQRNNMKCLNKIGFTKTESIAAGDIVAINGHVVMVDEVGADPFGLKNIKRAADCTSARISSRNFDFVIAQSSPSKDGIGINRFTARDYLATSATYRTGLTAYAVAACRARFGATPNLKSPSLSVVRHKRTPECKMAPLKLNKEECVDSCKAI